MWTMNLGINLQHTHITELEEAFDKAIENSYGFYSQYDVRCFVLLTTKPGGGLFEIPIMWYSRKEVTTSDQF